MHLSEGVLPFSHSITWSVIAIPTLLWSIRGEQVERQNETNPVPIMAAVTSILFAATLLPIPVPIVGATSHICLTPLFALIVGIRRIVWPTFFVLLLQAMFFAHGGITTLGINTLTLGVVGPLVTLVIWWASKKVDLNNAFTLALACALGGLSVYVTDALVLAVALSDLASPMTTFISVTAGFAPVQVPLVFLEAFISVKIVQTVSSRRADLLPFDLKNIGNFNPPLGHMVIVLATFFLTACDYRGIDDSVFGATTEKLGRPPTDGFIDFSQGEVGLAFSILILFAMGFFAGRTWERLFSRGQDALSR